MPDLPPDKWTATVLETWGVVRLFLKVKRDFDGLVLPIMETECVQIDKDHIPKARIKKKETQLYNEDEPLLF